MYRKRVALAARREVLRLTQSQVATLVGAVTNTVQRWERGESAPSTGFLEPLAKALKVSLPELDRLLDPDAVVCAPILGTDWQLPFDSPQFIGHHTEAPRSVGQREIDQLGAASKQLAQLEYQFGGGGLVRQTGAIQLQWASALLAADCPTTLRSPLFAAVARLSMRVGATAFDLSDHEAARSAFMFACRAAEEVGDWHLRAKVYSYLSRQSAWLDAPDEGLTFADRGLVRSDRLTASERAMLHVSRARCLARMGQIQQTLRAVGYADEAFASHRPELDPPWMAYYDAASAPR